MDQRIYVEVAISGSAQQCELLIPTMVELGCEGFQETEDSLLCYFDKGRWTSDGYLSFLQQVKRMIADISSNASIAFREFPEENWNSQWEKTIQPIELGTRITIKPSWSSYTNVENRLIIEIDPKMSFGTGYHETTRLMLRLLEEHFSPGLSVLDVGTGTGILAIAAAKLGATSVMGIDNDPWSIKNAQENILLNRVQHVINISDTELDGFADSSYDLLMANLTLNTNIAMLPQFKRILKQDGLLLLSGLLTSDRHAMLSALAKERLPLLEEKTENEWIAVAVKRES